MKKIIYSILLSCVACVYAQAEDVRKPDTRLADNSFFDPTRKREVVEDYHFGMEYRIEAGFVQHQQRTLNLSSPDFYLHGVRLGATFTFLLPKNFSLQTGLLYTLVYGRQQQHWRSITAANTQEEYIQHRVLEHNFTIPVRAFYTVPVWKQLNLFFYAGPQLHIGLAENDYMQLHLSEDAKNWLDAQGIHTSAYDRFDDELIRANIQLGVGAGLEWDRYRLQGGYDFGLNNQIKHPKVAGQHMWEWGWYASFSYRF